MIIRLIKSIMFLLISCLSIASVLAQSPTLSFRTIFETPKDEVFNSIVQDSKGDFIAVGTRDSNATPGTYEVLIFAKLDSNGIILHQRELKTTLGGIRHEIAEINEGYLLWYTNSWLAKGLIKLNYQGEIQWETETPSDYDAVCFTTDGVVGAKSSDEIVQDSVIEHITLQKLDLSGTLLWSDTIFRSSYPNDPGNNSGPAIGNVRDLIETRDGDFVVIGLASLWGNVVTDGDGYPYLIKTDANRNSLWNNFYDSFWRNYPDKLIEAANGDFLAVGTKDVFRPTGPYLERLGILRFSSSGNLLFSTESKSIRPGKDILEFEPNKILVISGDSQIFQFKSSLVIQDSMVYNSDNIWSIIKTTDNELAMSGNWLSNDGILQAMVSKSGDTIMSGLYPKPILSNDNNVKIYPNPNSGHFTLSLDKLFTQPILVEINNIMGQTIHTVTYKNIIQHDFDLSREPKGMYFVRVIAGEEMISMNKVFIQ